MKSQEINVKEYYQLIMIAIVLRVSIGVEIIMAEFIITYGIGCKNYARFKMYKKIY